MRDRQTETERERQRERETEILASVSANTAFDDQSVGIITVNTCLIVVYSATSEWDPHDD